MHVAVISPSQRALEHEVASPLCMEDRLEQLYADAIMDWQAVNFRYVNDLIEERYNAHVLDGIKRRAWFLVKQRTEPLDA